MDHTGQEQEINMDSQALCREDIFTDSKVGTIRRLTPVTPEGSEDTAREVTYFGSTQILTPAGALPLNFEIPGVTLQDAVAGFGEAAQQAVEQTMEELKEMQRQQASQIVVPKGGMGGGGIQMP